MDSTPIFPLLLIFGTALTWGQRNTPDGCFQAWDNSQPTCLSPYDTRTGLSDQQCRDVAVRSSSPCKAVQYNANTRTCQMFQNSVDDGCSPPPPPPGPPPRGGPPPPGPPPPGPPSRGKRSACGCKPVLQSSQGCTHYKFTGRCNGGPPTVVTLPTTKLTTTLPTTTTTMQLPPGATCPAGQLVRYYIVDGYQLSSTPDATFTATNEQSCIDACTNNRLPDGRQIPCKLIDFDTTSSKCSISYSGTGVAQSIPNGQIKHYEKTCVDSTFGTQCPGPYFRGPQKILIGFAQAVAGVSSAEECLQMCSSSQSRFGFVCQSVMYYSQETTNNCILNSETRLSYPDLYVAETTDKVDYYEIGCTSVRALRAIVQKSKRNRNVLVPNSNDYSGWTMCDQKVLDHKRYRRCKGMNPNKCDVDKAQCDPAKEDTYDLPIITTTTTTSAPSNCEPAIRPNGGRDCNNGSRPTRDGRREWCKPRC